MNIFARELERILQARGKSLSTLYTLRTANVTFLPTTVSRLQQTLSGELEAQAFVNPIELHELSVHFHFSPQEMQCLRSALVAEAVRVVLRERMKKAGDWPQLGTGIPLSEVINRVVELLFTLLTTRSEGQVQLIEQVLLSVRESESSQLVSSERISEHPSLKGEESANRALEPAIGTYYQAIMWLAIGRDTDDAVQRLGYFAQARALLRSAYTLTEDAAGARGTLQQQSWQEQIIQSYKVLLQEYPPEEPVEALDDLE